MQKTGLANLPLHGGKAPAWLFARMKLLAGSISEIIIRDYGTEEFLKKLSDPFWFQSFGCVLGFDWHSSGLTTTVCGAIKEGLKDFGPEAGIYVCGGKGSTSRKTPDEIEKYCSNLALDAQNLVYSSKMSAKVDNTAIQDGYQLYHHMFIFTKNGQWTVIQQGMNREARYARRYHWLNLAKDIDFVSEPHTGIIAPRIEKETLNLVAKDSEEARNCEVYLVNRNPDKILSDYKKVLEINMPRHHDIKEIKPENFHKILIKTYEKDVKNFEGLLATSGVGPGTIRALSLISELIYGAKPSYNDPAKFTFAHGGKDGIPYPVNRPGYDQSIEILRDAIEKAKIGDNLKHDAIKKLAEIH